MYCSIQSSKSFAYKYLHTTFSLGTSCCVVSLHMPTLVTIYNYDKCLS